MNQLRAELVAQVESYLFNEISMEALDAWVVGHLQMILDSGDERAIELADGVDGGFVQLGEGAIAAEELHEELDGLARAAATVAETTSTNALQHEPIVATTVVLSPTSRDEFSRSGANTHSQYIEARERIPA